MILKTGYRKKDLVPVGFLSIVFFLFLVNGVYAAEVPGGKDIPIDNEVPKIAFVPGQVIVKLKSGYGMDDLLSLQSAAVDSSRELPMGYLLLDITGGVLDACSEIGQKDYVDVVEPNYVRYLQFEPNDPSWNIQWNLKLSHAAEGWDFTTGNANVTVAVIDTGVDYNHPELINNLVDGKNFRTTSESYLDDSGHGTAVTGVIGAVGNNLLGIAGAAWNVSIMPLRACGDAGLICRVSDEVEAIEEAIAQNVDIINLSLGGTNPSVLEEESINRAWNNGILIFAAVGNQGKLGKFNDPENTENIAFPAGYKNVCGVSSIVYPVAGKLSIVQLSDFSNSGDAVSVTAVGTHVMTTAPTYVADYSIFGAATDYGRISGTSFSTPLVSGLAAIIKSQFPNMTNVEIRKRIEDSARDIGSPGRDDKFGHGLVDFYSALVGGGFSENQHFVVGVTSSPIVYDEVLIVVKSKIEVISSPQLMYFLINKGEMDQREIALHKLQNHENVWIGRFNTVHVGSIRLNVTGDGVGGALIPLEMEYFKAE